MSEFWADVIKNSHLLIVGSAATTVALYLLNKFESVILGIKSNLTTSNKSKIYNYVVQQNRPLKLDEIVFANLIWFFPLSTNARKMRILESVCYQMIQEGTLQYKYFESKKGDLPAKFDLGYKGV